MFIVVWTVAVSSMKWPEIYSSSVSLSKISIEINLQYVPELVFPQKHWTYFSPCTHCPPQSEFQNIWRNLMERTKILDVSVYLLFYC
jgi:hypothetical protein